MSPFVRDVLNDEPSTNVTVSDGGWTGPSPSGRVGSDSIVEAVVRAKSADVTSISVLLMAIWRS
ncbi:hypothetical protein [Tessaracoccus sp. Z1128]